MRKQQKNFRGLLATTGTLHPHGQNKTVLSCIVGGVATISDKSRLFSVVRNLWRLNSFVQPCLRSQRVCKQVLVANWKLSRDKATLCSLRVSRLDKTVSKFSVADSLDLSPILSTPLTRTRQDDTSLVWYCPCRRRELSIMMSLSYDSELTSVNYLLVHFVQNIECKYTVKALIGRSHSHVSQRSAAQHVSGQLAGIL